MAVELRPSLLMSLTRSPANQRDEADAWLVRTARELLSLSGVHSARHLVELDDPTRTITAHDVDADSADAVLAELRSRETNDPEGRAVIGQALRREHRIYRPVPVPTLARADDDAEGELASCVWWTPQPGTEAELDAWYDQEHIPLLMRVPGWLRIRRFELVEGSGPRWFAMHDIATAAALAEPSRAEVRKTPWRATVLADREQYDSQMCSAHHIHADA